MSYQDKIIEKDLIHYGRLLRGHYEEDRLPKDFSPERMVPDFAFNVLNPLGLLYRPIVDEDHLRRGGEKHIWPGQKPFAVCLTHDVDLVSLQSYEEKSRIRIRQVLENERLLEKARGLFGLGIDRIRFLRDFKRQDQMHCFERWLEIEAAVGTRSTFFFWPGWGNVIKHHPTDCAYELTDKIVFDGQKCTVTEMIREIHRRGWEIGLHSSWYSFDDVEEMKGQKGALEVALGHEVVSVRQHYLHYDIRVTPRVHAEAGIRYDSTLGFNDNIGFRFGTCHPWRLYDLRNEEKLPVVEIPLIIQDGALLNQVKGMRLDEDTAYQYITQITEAVERVSGILTLLWHPTAVINPPWWNLYIRTLEYLKSKNAWFCCIKDVPEATVRDEIEYVDKKQFAP